MVCREAILIFLFVVHSLEGKTLQNQPGYSYDLDAEQNDWWHLKWDSIFEQSSSKDFSHKMDENERDGAFENSNNGGFSVYENKNLKHKKEMDLSEDEVFIHEKKTHTDKTHELNVLDTSTETCDKETVKIEKYQNETEAFDMDKNTLKSTMYTELPKTNTDDSVLKISQTIPTTNSDKMEHALHESVHKDLMVGYSSFIFNPNAQSQEHFQNCTTPRNESGSCRYLQHCLIPSTVSSLVEFMKYACIIKQSFIGVCCPDFPVTVIEVKKETKAENGIKFKECGLGSIRRIFGGSEANPKAWPWMVALFSKLLRNLICGVVLINNRYVFTAAHCTFHIPNNEIVARLGEYDFKDDGESQDEYSVTEIKRHGRYDFKTLQNDIALLKLEKSVEFNEFIQAICLPEKEKLYVGEIATLAGWGNTRGGFTSGVLLEASFPVVSNEECEKAHGVPIPQFLICTSSPSEGACHGDSGGPLMLLDENDRWKVIGLVSWVKYDCNPKFPTVYTRVSHFIDWIKEHSH